MFTHREREQRLYNVYHFRKIIYLSYSDANEAYEALEKYDDDSKYSIVLGYLAMSQQSYLEAMRIYFEKELDHYEIENFFTAYEEYIFQLKKVITDKDQNTSWLFTSHEKLMDCWKSVDNFLGDWVNNNIKQK
ncbi:hypothetical protein J1TS5_03760 [Paenibacillus macerans]|uniref:hypothetical protein n=1 Tax=Paenibacillus macerans TaxID=44252 RepID=UPI001B192184|nr:hypothetical protein [Paenibacillus macerans]GIP08206.1 hypothetical protein J1TS5_03760 [Paenibacillus macerans]